MTIISVQSTPSFRYYMNKRKDDIIWRIGMMANELKEKGLDVPKHAADGHSILVLKTKDELAGIAMQCHRAFPAPGEMWTPYDSAPWQEVIWVRNDAMDEPVKATRGYYEPMTKMVVGRPDAFTARDNMGMVLATEWKLVKDGE